MKLVACSLLLLVACKEVDDDDYHVEPGGGGGTFGTTTDRTDAGTGDGGSQLRSGRVCGLVEIFEWDDCNATGMGGLTVSVGTKTAMTMATGDFMIEEPSGSNLLWRVSGSIQVSSIYELVQGTTIPSIANSTYEDLAAEANIGLEANTGAIFVRVISGNAPVEDVTATLAGSQDLVYYDDPLGAARFSVGQTRQAGMIWFPNVAPGAAVTFTVTPPAAVAAPKDTVVTVEPNTATFVIVAVAPVP